RGVRVAVRSVGVGYAGARLCAAVVVPIDETRQVGFARGRPSYWLACLLGNELVVRGAQLPNFLSGDAHGRLPSTMRINSLTTKSRNPSQRSRSKSAAILSCAA